MNGHAEVREALAGYALDALDPVETAAVEAHLASCAECRAELADLQRVVAGMGLSAEPEMPPPGLKSRVLANALGRSVPARTGPVVSSGRSWWRGPAGLAVAASLALAVAASLWAISLRSGLASLDRTVTILTAPDLHRVELKGQAGAPNAAGRAFWSTSRGLVFSAERLPALDAAHVYQLWTIHNGTPVSAGLLTVDRTGAAAHQSPPPPGATMPDAVAVSIEPAGGVSAPTGAIVLVGKPN
jgi:anti-sigma-K factor RskA